MPLLRETRREAVEPATAVARYAVAGVRDRCLFTIHTPVEAGTDKFEYELVRQILGDYVERDVLKALGGSERLNMTQLTLNLSGYVNGMARRHAETTRKLFPGYEIASITNGVHTHTWTHRAFGELHAQRFANWAPEPEVLAPVGRWRPCGRLLSRPNRT